MNEFDDGYLDDMPEDEGFSFSEEGDFEIEDQLLIIEDFDKFATHVLQFASIDADLTLAGYKPEDPMKLELLEEAIKLPYDPSYDIDFVPKHELEHLINEFIISSPGGIGIMEKDINQVCTNVAKRIIYATFEKAAKEGLLEPMVDTNGNLIYREVVDKDES